MWITLGLLGALAGGTVQLAGIVRAEMAPRRNALPWGDGTPEGDALARRIHAAKADASAAHDTGDPWQVFVARGALVSLLDDLRDREARGGLDIADRRVARHVIVGLTPVLLELDRRFASPTQAAQTALELAAILREDPETNLRVQPGFDAATYQAAAARALASTGDDVGAAWAVMQLRADLPDDQSFFAHVHAVCDELIECGKPMRDLALSWLGDGPPAVLSAAQLRFSVAFELRDHDRHASLHHLALVQRGLQDMRRAGTQPHGPTAAFEAAVARLWDELRG